MGSMMESTLTPEQHALLKAVLVAQTESLGALESRSWRRSSGSITAPRARQAGANPDSLDQGVAKNPGTIKTMNQTPVLTRPRHHPPVAPLGQECARRAPRFSGDEAIASRSCMTPTRLPLDRRG